MTFRQCGKISPNLVSLPGTTPDLIPCDGKSFSVEKRNQEEREKNDRRREEYKVFKNLALAKRKNGQDYDFRHIRDC